jgi:uncharacterized membrane protein
MSPTAQSPRGATAPGFWLGFAFSGLFDGILLHQVLQWHHLLSLVEGEAFRDLRVQVMADGAFHSLMYLIGALGLLLAWRRRQALAQPGAGRRVAGAFVLGFGVWNVVDAVVFHWVLQIHHIRLDPGERLAWDVGWLVALGLLPLALGWRVWRGGGGGGAGAGLSGRAAAASLSLLLAAAAAVSLLPQRSPLTAVLFRPGLTDGEVLGAVAAVGGRAAWVDPSGDLVMVALADPAARWRLYGLGALMVGGAGPAGCLAFAEPA